MVTNSASPSLLHGLTHRRSAAGSARRLQRLGFAAGALAGSTLSAKQEDLLAHSHARQLTLLIDGDDVGRRVQAELLSRLARRFFVRVVELPDGSQPDTIRQHQILNNYC